MVRDIDQKKIALYAILIGALIKKKMKKPQKTIWCKKWLQRRAILGTSVTLLRELRDEREIDFVNYMRMDINTFYTLLAKVQPYIMRKDTNMRQSITPEARLEATLRFLASGCSYTALQYSTGISKQSL